MSIKCHFLILNILIVLSSSADNNKIDFYNKLLQDSMFKNVKLNIDNEGLFLVLAETISPNEDVAKIDKEFIFSSCDYFPLRELFTDLFINYYKQSGYTGQLKLESFVNRFTTVYHMLFTKLAHEGDVVKYFQKDVNKQNEFIKVRISESKRSYVNIIPGFIANKSVYSLMWFDRQDLANAKNLGIDISEYELTMGLFEYINKYVSKMNDNNLKLILTPIIKDLYNFKRYTDYVSKKSTQLNYIKYSVVYNNDIIESYINFNESLFNKYSLQITECTILAPIVDLIRVNPGAHARKVKFNDLIMDAKIEYKGISFKFNSWMKEDSIMAYTMLYCNNEELYLKYGIIREGFPIFLAIEFNRSDFADPKKVDLCVDFACNRFDIKKFISEGRLKALHNFDIDGKFLNLELLNYFTLIEFDENNLNNNFTKLRLSQFSKIDLNTENKALNRYLELITKNLSKNDFVKLGEDLNKVKAILKQVIENKIKFKDDYESVIYSLKNTINLLTIAYEKIGILINEEILLYKEFFKNIQSDISKIRTEFRNIKN
jgi:hypothetical protein